MVSDLGQGGRSLSGTFERASPATDGDRRRWGIPLFFLFVVLTSAAMAVVMVVSVVALSAMGMPIKPFDRAAISTTSLSPAFLIFGESFLFIAVAVATVIMSRIEKRPLADYHVGLVGALARVAQGLGWGAVTMAVLMGMIWLLHGVRLAPAAAPPATVAMSALMWAGGFLLVGAVEEMMLRGYLLRALARRLNFRWAAVISSGAFMALHIPNGGETVFGLIQVFLIGLVFCFSIWRTGTIWWAVGYHAAWDWTQSSVFGVADSGLTIAGSALIANTAGPDWLSGGATGPEASALMFVILAATVAIIWLGLKHRDEPMNVGW